MTVFILSGARYGRLLALEDAVKSRDRINWQCRCGRTKLILATHVKYGHIQSCGCLLSETATAKVRKYHSRQSLHTKHPLYGIWKGMMARTSSPKHKSYSEYGGRGIEVFRPWHDPKIFYQDIERIIGPRPSLAHSLDRINNDKHYSPDNVRWADAPTQNRNRRQTPTSCPECGHKF